MPGKPRRHSIRETRRMPEIPPPSVPSPANVVVAIGEARRRAEIPRPAVPSPANVVAGMGGAGCVAGLHIPGWRQVTAVPVEVRGVAAAHADRAQQFATEFGVEVAYRDFDELLADP